jgi:TonB-linked SusC/RagA family outer membrane protein
MRKIVFFLSLVMSGLLAYGQDITVTGKVTNSSGKGLVAINVQVKETKKGTATGEDGSFSISAPSNGTLVFTGVGFVSKEIAVNGTSSLSVELMESSTELNTVVVTALGIQRQAKSLVYATQSVKVGTLTEVRDPNNMLNSLQGKVAGAVITQGSGGPGSGARIVLRGNRSIEGSNNALIVVDGVPITNNTNSTAGNDFGSVQGSDGASNINPDDIESVNILRGASAAALYGSQAGNGVVVITTKKGARGKIDVTVNSGIAFEKAFSLPKVQNAYGQGTRMDAIDATVGDSWGPKMTGQAFTNHLGASSSYSSQPDNIKNFFRTGLSLNNSIGISGGSDKMQTYFSYTNNKIDGIVPKNDLMRHTVNLRVANQINKWFSTDAKATYISQTIKNRPRTGEENAPVIDIYQIPRNVSLADAQNYEKLNNVGVAETTPWPSTLNSIYQNPYWMINNSSLNESRDRIMGFISAKIQFTPWLSLTGRANLDKTMDRLEETYAQGTILWASQPGGYFAKNNINTTQKWFDLILSGSNTLSKDFKINYNLGTIYQDNKYDQNQSTANGLNVTNKFSLNFATNPALSSNGNQVQTQAAFGQLGVAFKDAIFLDGSFRNDWDSRLPSPNTFQYYSAGASIVLSDLVMLPKPFSFLKANLNYAEVGNGGKFGLLNATYSYGQGAGNGFLSRSTTLPFPTLKPEIVKSIEAGIDARFFESRLGITVNYYKSNSKNQLLSLDLPPATGYAKQYINAGNIQNKGVEIVLNATPIKTKHFNWDLALNFALNRNKVVELSDDIKTIYYGGNNARSATPVVKEGGSFGDLYAYQWIRDDKGNYKVTADGKPLTTQATGTPQDYIGNFSPRETVGLSNTITYKSFSFRFLVDGRIGGTMVSGTEMNLAFSGITEGTEKYREGGWSLGGVDANGAPVTKTITAQDFWQTASGKRYGVGEFFAYNATSFRARELSLGYDIPVGANIFIKSIRFSAVARNLFWIYRGKSIIDIPGLEKRTMWFDPDMSLGNGNYQGVEYGALPSTRSIGFNLKLNF